MTQFPTIERLRELDVPTLLIAGERDPLVNRDRISVLFGMENARAVMVPGAHALNHSHPALIAALVRAAIADGPVHTEEGVLSVTTQVAIPS
jgi:pimeloyl-ACP methyl ester carboxylesterase